jgi:hypothetical protein
MRPEGLRAELPETRGGGGRTQSVEDVRVHEDTEVWGQNLKNIYI